MVLEPSPVVRGTEGTQEPFSGAFPPSRAQGRAQLPSSPRRRRIFHVCSTVLSSSNAKHKQISYSQISAISEPADRVISDGSWLFHTSRQVGLDGIIYLSHLSIIYLSRSEILFTDS